MDWLHVDWLTFIDHLIGHLAWPLAVIGLILFILVRRRALLEGLLHRARKVEGGPFKLELDQAKAEAEEARLPPAPAMSSSVAEEIPLMHAVDEPEPWLVYLFHLVHENPRKAVLEAYSSLNKFLLRVAKHLDHVEPERLRYTDGSPSILRPGILGVLAAEEVDVLDPLRRAAGYALDADDEEVSPERAIQYLETVSRLVLAVRERLGTTYEKDNTTE